MSRATLVQLSQYGLPSAVLAVITPVIQQAELDAADELVNGYLRVRYTLPLASFGLDLVRHTCAIAAYNLICVRGYNPQAANDEHLRARYEDAMSYLKAVSKAQLDPGIVDSTPEVDETIPVISSDCARGW